MERSREDYIGSGAAPSFLEAIPDWHYDAACAQPPYDGWKWVIEPSSGKENAGTVLKTFPVCMGCPVRRECLISALEESRFTPVGIFGATTTTERQAAWGERMKKAAADPNFRLWSSRKPEGVSAAVGEGDMPPSARHRMAVEIADTLDASYDKRVRIWQRLMSKQVRNRVRQAKARAAAKATALESA